MTTYLGRPYDDDLMLYFFSNNIAVGTNGVTMPPAPRLDRPEHGLPTTPTPLDHDPLPPPSPPPPPPPPSSAAAIRSSLLIGTILLLPAQVLLVVVWPSPISWARKKYTYSSDSLVARPRNNVCPASRLIVMSSLLALLAHSAGPTSTSVPIAPRHLQKLTSHGTSYNWFQLCRCF